MPTHNPTFQALASVVALAATAVYAQQICSCGHAHSGPCRLWIDETGGGEGPSRGPGNNPGTSIASEVGAGQAGGAGASLQIRNRWGRTASTPFATPVGSPVTLTWGLVRDGATLPSEEQSDGTFRRDPSNLISFLDNLFGSGGQTIDLTTRPWFPVVESAYERWESISGLTFNYEPNDDRAPVSGSTSSSRQGQLGVRADMRVAGHFIDGQTGSNTLAYNYFPQAGDMVIDTSNTSFYGNPSSNYLRLRNVIAHEIGHGIGLNHLESNNSNQLMEPFITTVFDGPQIDDILAAQRSYGDAWEKNGGNDSTRRATQVGTVQLFDAWAIGVDGERASGGALVQPDQVDFVSIDDRSDLDYYRFVAGEDGLLDFRVTPVGPTYNSGPQGGSQSPFATSELSRLGITVYDSRGAVVASQIATSLGETVTLDDLPAAAGETLFARVEGLERQVQLYRLDAALNPAPEEGTDFDFTSFGGAQFDAASLIEDGVSISLNAGGDGDKLTGFAGGYGVLSSRELFTETLSQVGAGETIEFSFDQQVILKNLQLTGLSVDGREAMALSFVDGVNPFEGLTGYDGAYTLIGEQGLQFRSPAWQGEGVNVPFGLRGQSRLVIEPGTVLSLGGTRGSRDRGFFLRSLTIEPVPEPSTALLAGVAAAALARRRRTVVPRCCGRC